MIFIVAFIGLLVHQAAVAQNPYDCSDTSLPEIKDEAAGVVLEKDNIIKIRAAGGRVTFRENNHILSKDGKYCFGAFLGEVGVSVKVANTWLPVWMYTTDFSEMSFEWLAGDEDYYDYAKFDITINRYDTTIIGNSLVDSEDQNGDYNQVKIYIGNDGVVQVDQVTDSARTALFSLSVDRKGRKLVNNATDVKFENERNILPPNALAFQNEDSFLRVGQILPIGGKMRNGNCVLENRRRDGSLYLSKKGVKGHLMFIPGDGSVAKERKLTENGLLIEHQYGIPGIKAMVLTNSCEIVLGAENVEYRLVSIGSLPVGTTFHPGARLLSANNRCHLVNQPGDGNVVMYKPNAAAWHFGTHTDPAGPLPVQLTEKGLTWNGYIMGNDVVGMTSIELGDDDNCTLTLVSGNTRVRFAPPIIIK